MVEFAESSQLLFRPMRPTNAYEETIRRLLQSIRLGLIRPGERFPPERELSNMLKVSRDTVREALSSLSEQGFIVSKRGRYGGTFVVDELPHASAFTQADAVMSKHEINDLIMTRRVLEVGAVSVAANKDLTAEQRSQLADTLAETAQAAPEDYRRSDSRLHLLIAELSGSPTLVQMMADMRSRLNASLETLPILPVNLNNSNDQHQAIVEAILAGKAHEATVAMAEHIEGSEALLHGYLSSTL